jgi:hypothetical protein
METNHKIMVAYSQRLLLKILKSGFWWDDSGTNWIQIQTLPLQQWPQLALALSSPKPRAFASG